MSPSVQSSLIPPPSEGRPFQLAASVVDVRLMLPAPVQRRSAVRETATCAVDNTVLEKVRAEFLDMPGLQLTFRQAQRLWQLGNGECQQSLCALIDAKFLCRKPDGRYARASIEPVGTSRAIVKTLRQGRR